MSWIDSAVQWDERCDVLVIGSGAGGLIGAYTAAREGLSVIVIEATDRFGGATAYSGGGMWFPGNPMSRRAGDHDTVESAVAGFGAAVGSRTPADLQRAYVTGGAPLIEYLESDPAFEFQALSRSDCSGSQPHAGTGGRRIAPAPLPAAALGALAAALRAPLGTDRGAEPAPEELTGGRALLGRALVALDRFPGVSLRREHWCRELVRLAAAPPGRWSRRRTAGAASAPRTACSSRRAASSAATACAAASGYRAAAGTRCRRRGTSGPRSRPPWPSEPMSI